MINVKNLIKKFDLDKREIAGLLFPDNMYPGPALKRIIDGEAQLDAEQISRLALYLSMEVTDLYEGGAWKSKTIDGKHVFTNGDYRAELDLDNLETKLFHKDAMFHETILHSKSIPLSDYLTILNDQINKFNFQKNESN